jgi:hypothetical protein
VHGRKHGDADFGSCLESPNLSMRGMTGMQARRDSVKKRLIGDELTATAWFSCTDGCCSAQWPPSS